MTVSREEEKLRCFFLQDNRKNKRKQEMMMVRAQFEGKRVLNPTWTDGGGVLVVRS